MNESIYQVDAFTKQAFSGNPAGVVLLNKGRSDKWMLSVASEMNLSETAFLIGEKDSYSLRWFSPAIEVDLCGHATLSAAHILYEEGIVEKSELIKFVTRSGVLTTSFVDGWIEMNFPSFTAEKIVISNVVIQALKSEPVEMYNSGENIIAVFSNPEDIYNLSPDFNLIKQLDAQGVIVTSLSDEAGFDFISRYFAPKVGVDEDPVTGSAHCNLGPYWGGVLRKDVFRAKQVSDRGGELLVRVEGERTFIRGQAVTIFSGKIHI